MDSASVVPHGVPTSTRDGWRSIEHRVLKRRASVGRGPRRRRQRFNSPVRDAFETWRSRAHASHVVARLITIALATLAIADLIIDAPPLRQASYATSVLLAGTASLLAVASVERAGHEHSRRWQLQAVACAMIMLMLMATGIDGGRGDGLWFLIVVGVASTLVALATSYKEGGGAVCLALDSAIVGFTTALMTIALASANAPVGGAAILLGAFGAAGYAVAVATRPAVRANPHGSDALFLGGVLVLCLSASGEAARQIGFGAPAFLAAPGVALFGTLGLARSGWSGPRRAPEAEPGVASESRLRLVPAVAAAGAIVVLSWVELEGRGTRAGFFGIIMLFGLIVGRLLLTLVENRQLVQRDERSGVFEEKLRDLGGALVAALDRKDTLELVCRTAQLALAADSVLLWMVDSSTDELEAVEGLSAKRETLLRRRLTLQDPTSLAVRVAQTGLAEIVESVPSAYASNGFLNVLLHAQALLAVPIVHGGRVQGVLVSVDAKSPAAYGPRELAKAELLASQVAVALDNAYQHALQRRRLEELTALYQFAQSAYSALSSVEIVRQLLPIVKERLNYTYGTIWLRDETTGTLRLGAGDGPQGAVRGLRPSPLAMRAFLSGEPARAGLGWDDTETPTEAE